MYKASVADKNISSYAREEKYDVKEEFHYKFKLLELKRQKSLFDSKYKCLVEVMNIIVNELEYITKFKEKSQNDDAIRLELELSLTEQIQKALEYIEIRKIDLKKSLYKDYEFNKVALEEKEIDAQSLMKMNYWKLCLEEILGKVKLVPSADANKIKKIFVDEIEYNIQKTKVENEIKGKAFFYQSLKKLEDDSINDFFNTQVDKINADFKALLKIKSFSQSISNPELNYQDNYNCDKPNDNKEQVEEVTTIGEVF